ncbi:hypothetical protein [Nocardioides sp. B-3]|uniref:hypothetical protein n=1 Tax=Nocardioides sp. B-3 TaxID=2895565 RepID=UPI00300DC89A
MRIRLDLSYDGTDFKGWATQPSLRTVQGSLEDALAMALRVPLRVVCAGRTDTGVHARGRSCTSTSNPIASCARGDIRSNRRSTRSCAGSTASRTATCAYAVRWRRRRGSMHASRRSGGATPTGSLIAPS